MFAKEQKYIINERKQIELNLHFSIDITYTINGLRKAVIDPKLKNILIISVGIIACGFK